MNEYLDTKAVFGHCEECGQRVESDFLIVETDPIKGDKFFCNRCRAKPLGNIYPAGFDKSNFWIIADLCGYMLDENGNYVLIESGDKQPTNKKPEIVYKRQKDVYTSE